MFAEAAVDITIRQYELDDAGPLLDAALESVSEVGLWLPWCHSGLTLADVRRWAVIFSLVRTDILPTLGTPGDDTHET